MKVAKADTIEKTYELLNSGLYGEIELNFDLNTDDFFKIAMVYGDKGAKIKRKNKRFIIKLKSNW